ncbi:hypothetical protein [Cupriavidus basilensis]|uniref:Uncharacterized protein n=1 Tax=Cupriavidus basilensis TaxID=68895 RepID=A0A643G4B6_9BURK|nr:hypothetical protein [Cupriavidus basilensis]QOT74839.1 hypothetical protein F7R26_011230 [Cupriavidus basilensis]
MSETEFAGRLTAAKSVWDEMAPGLGATALGGSNMNVPTEQITDWFETLIAAVASVEKYQKDQVLMSLLWPPITNSTQQIESYMSTAKSNGISWLSQTTPTIVSHLWGLRSQLQWLIPTEQDGFPPSPAIGETLAKRHEIEEVSKLILGQQKKIQKIASDAEKITKEILDRSELISSAERTSATAQTNALASAAAAEAEKLKVDQYVASLSTASIAQEKLFKQFDDKRSDIEGTLEGASKIALAKSFKDRRESLDRTQILWAALFLIGITFLVLSGAFIWHDTKTNSVEFSSEKTALIVGLSKYLLLAPFIWLTWFSAKQYGHILRLTEDYAFKEAAAHSFVGYRNEMGDDGEMLQLLREYAIKNFGANPVRVLSKNEPASPISEILEKALEKLPPEKILDAFKDILSSTKGK